MHRKLYKCIVMNIQIYLINGDIMKLKLFWQDNCPNCPKAKALLKDFNQMQTESFDINSIDGMTEAAFHAIMATPSIVIVDQKDNEIAAWRSEMPTIEEILSFSDISN